MDGATLVSGTFIRSQPLFGDEGRRGTVDAPLPYGALLRPADTDQTYVVHGGLLRRIPDQQTLHLGGYAGRAVQTVPPDRFGALPAGRTLSRFGWAVAMADFWSVDRRHHVSARASLDLASGILTGTLTATNYARRRPFASVAVALLRTAAGTLVPGSVPPVARLRAPARGLGRPATRTCPLPGGVPVQDSTQVCRLDLVVTDQPDLLDAALADPATADAEWCKRLLHAVGTVGAHGAGAGSMVP